MITKLKTEKINREVIKPANKIEIILYLLTRGKKGKLWKIVVEPAIRYSPHHDARCRSVIVPMTKNKQEKPNKA